MYYNIIYLNSFEALVHQWDTRSVNKALFVTRNICPLSRLPSHTQYCYCIMTYMKQI